MTDDIVERLRTEWDRFARVPTENKFWLGPSTHARLAALFLEAADDIERLCKERDSLRESRDHIGASWHSVRKERDEARREVCEAEKYCREEAKRRGWNCFKEKTP